MRSRNQIMMRQMEEFVDDYYMTHHTAPKLQEIADNFHTVKSTVSRYLTEMAERGMVEYKDGVVSTSKTRKFDTEVMNIGIVGSVCYIRLNCTVSSEELTANSLETDHYCGIDKLL